MRVGFAVVLAMFGAVSAVAAPRIAVHPLVVMGGDARAVDQSRADFLKEVARQPIELVSRAEVARVLADQPGGACQTESEGCLEVLCRSTGAAYALLTTLMLDGPNFVLGARLVASDGTFVKVIEALPIPKDLFTARGPQVQAAFKQLFDQLGLGGLPEVVPPKQAEPQPQPQPQPQLQPVAVLDAPSDEPGDQGAPTGRVVGLVAGGVALVTAGVATAFALSAYSSGQELRSRLVGGLPSERDTPTAHAIDRNTTIATGLYAAAGVVAAASVGLILWSIDWSSPVAIAPIKGGAMVGFTGSF